MPSDKRTTVPPHHTPPHRTRRQVRLLLSAAVLASTSAIVQVPSAAADPTRSPATVLSADGRSATDGVRTLTVSQAAGLAADGQSIRVTGAGYDPNKGVYVALCVIPPPNVLPTPCGGGVDVEGQAGASQWISSNPPSYGVGLARPYGPGGSFDTTFSIRALISSGVDCRQVRCAVLTRNDHTRSADRSQDILVPVSFATPGAPAAPIPAPQPSPAPAAPAPAAPGAPATPVSPDPSAPSTLAPTTTSTTTPPAPAATVATDGRSVSDGTRTLSASRTDQLDARGDRIEVTGSGFDPARGIYVALCAIGEQGPGPCSSGSGRSLWLTSTAPEWAADLASEFGADGSFDGRLELEATIDADTDCTETACAIVVRADDTASDDRSLDLALPVSFTESDDATEIAPEVAPEVDAGDEVDAASSTISDDGDSRSRLVPTLVAAVLIAAAAAGATVVVRRRRSVA